MRKRLLTVLGTVLALAVLISGCGSKPAAEAPAAQTTQASGSNQAAQPSGEPIVIGVITSRTGNLSATGIQVATGVEQAAKEWNAKGGIGGRPIEVVVEDDAGNPSTAVNAFNKVLGRKPVAVFGPTFTPFLMAFEQGVKQAKIPVFTSATGVVITKSGDGWFFRLRTNDEKQGRLAATYAVQELKATKPAILYPNNDYGKGGYQVIKATLEQMGFPLVAEESFNQGDKDVQTQLLKIKRAGADLLISWTVPADSGMVAVQAKALGLGIPILGSPGFGTGEYLQLAGEATDGIHVIVDGAVGFDEASKPFVERVKQNFPDIPVSFVVSTNYDGANILFQAIEKAGTDPAKLREAILATKDYQGVTGPYSFDAEGNGLHQGVLAKWQGTKLVPVKTMSLDN